jgi:hypothetical protein
VYKYVYVLPNSNRTSLESKFNFRIFFTNDRNHLVSNTNIHFVFGMSLPSSSHKDEAIAQQVGSDISEKRPNSPSASVHSADISQTATEEPSIAESSKASQ